MMYITQQSFTYYYSIQILYQNIIIILRKIILHTLIVLEPISYIFEIRNDNYKRILLLLRWCDHVRM